jgi:hypothetical protein
MIDMLYTFLKKIIPIFIIFVTLYTLVFLVYIGGMRTTSYLIEQKALEIKERSINDYDFTNNVKVWVYKRVQTSPIYKGTPEIRPPEMAYLTGGGDCSERALLITRMLNDGGIEAHPIYGAVGPEEHESVEYLINRTTHRIDEKEFPNFVKHGDGIHPIEYIYDVYWFLDWKTVMGLNKSNKQWKY